MQQTPQIFRAQDYELSNGGTKHPSGKFPARVATAAVEPTKNNDGHLLKVEFETPAGKIALRYNLWNNNPTAVDIAQKQLATLCYATGVFELNMQNGGREFLGRNLQIEVRDQTDNRYSEVTRVFDQAGNEPTKAGPAVGQTAPVGQAAQQNQQWQQGGQTAPVGQAAQQNQQWQQGGQTAPVGTAPWKPGG